MTTHPPAPMPTERGTAVENESEPHDCCGEMRWQRSVCEECGHQEAWCASHGTTCGCPTPAESDPTAGERLPRPFGSNSMGNPIRTKECADAEPDAGDVTPMMDRPAYELVRLIEAQLDDADQITDTPQRPNRIAVWGIRMLLEEYGGKAHRWQWPKCFECEHQMPLHAWSPCDLCGCAITEREIADGERDEVLDEAVEQALRYEAEHRGDR